MKRTPEALGEGPFDLLILGGGVTGAGVALDAALRGLRVALIDKSDFASGTSSASSKLVHGGLRYLEHGNFKLVYEALHERRLLLGNAGHLVHPLRFVLPFYRGARLAPWKWRLALTLYDLLAGGSNIHRSRSMQVPSLLQEVATLRRDNLLGAGEYFDAQMDDARLCLEVIQTAAANGAVVANYVEAVAFEKQNGAIRAVRASDKISGRDYSIPARQVLNATGPWVDAVCRLAGDESGPHLRPTKGVHLVVGDLGFKSAFLFLHPIDGRVFFVIPWQAGLRPYPHNAKTLIGTTDSLSDVSPNSLSVTPEEIRYLLTGFNHYFTNRLSESDVLGTFAGLRPLIRARSDQPSAISREYQVFASPSGLLSVAGGKYTTFRLMAEAITDRVVRRLGKRRICRTHHFRLHGAPAEPWYRFSSAAVADLCQHYRLPPEKARHLVHRYGQNANEVAAYLENAPQLSQPVIASEPDLRVEFLYQREREMAILPADFLLRRTRLGLYHPELLQMPPAALGIPG